MTISVRVTRYGKKGLDTSFYSIFEPEPTTDEPIKKTSIQVTSVGVAWVTEDGEVQLIDNLNNAERVTVGTGSTQRIIWPVDKIRQ